MCIVLTAMALLFMLGPGLSSAAAQRLLTLTEMLTKQRTRMRARAVDPGPTDPSAVLSSSTSSTRSTATPVDPAVVASCLPMVLDILSIAVTHELQANPELLYALMYRQELFAGLAEDPELAAQCANIQVRIGTRGSGHHGH